MRKKDLTYVNIDSVDDIITNIDPEELPGRYALSARNIRIGKQGMIVQRRFGTKHLYANYPSIPTVASIVGGYRFYNKDNDTEYDIVLTTDPTTNYCRLYVNDSTLASNNIGTANNWIELTRAFTAQVNATPSTTTAAFVVKTVADSVGAAYNSGVFHNDEADYYICLNVAQNKVVQVLTNTGNTMTTPNYMGSDGMAFAVNDNLVFFRTNWDFNNFFKAKTSAWSGTDLNLSLGTIPHNRWLPVDAQKKVNLAIGDSSNPPVMRNLMRVQLNATKPRFYNGSAYLQTLPANWDSETVGGLSTFYTTKGTAGSPITSPFSNEVVTVLTDTNVDGVVGGGFLQLNYSFVQTSLPGSKIINLRVAVTLEYDGYQESDPIYRSYMQCPADSLPSITINSVSFNPGSMPRHITAVNFYSATHDNSLEAKDWLESDSDYILGYSFPVNSIQYNSLGVETNYSGSGVRWSIVSTSAYCYSLVCGLSLGSGAVFSCGGFANPVYTTSGASYNNGDVLTLVGGDGTATATVISVQTTFPGGPELLGVIMSNPGISGYTIGIYATTGPRGQNSAVIQVIALTAKFVTSTGGTLAGNLSHATDPNRSLIAPRYLVQSARNQAAIIVAVKDDTTLRMTCYDGAGVHEDDNYPDITSDSNNNRQLLPLNGRGIVQGESISRDTIYIFHPTEAETFDLQQGSQQLFDIDFLCKDSLVKSPYGLTWAGRAGLYCLPESGSSIRIINPLWINKYDGTLMTDDGVTPFITDAYRAGIISGYDPFSKSVWFQYQMTIKAGGTTEYECAEYYFETDKWSFKKIGGSTLIKYFSSTTKLGGTSSAKLLIGYSSGILQYPNMIGNFPYQDLVTSADASSSTGYETDVTINVRDLYDQVQESNLVCFMVEHNGASITGSGIYSIEFYANQEVNPFDTQYISIDRPGEFRYIDARGNIDSLRIRGSLLATTLSDYKKFDVSRIVLGFKKNVRQGNI